MTMKRLNNKTLVIVLVILLAAFALTKAFRAPHLESNLKTMLFQVDTARVTQVQIYPQKPQEKEIRLTKNGSQWQVAQGQKSAPANKATVEGLLGAITNVGIQRMVSRKKTDWNDYFVGDTTGARVAVYAGTALLVNFHIGSTAKGTGPYRQSNSYIRLNKQNEVYQADVGSMASFFNKSYDDWRNHAFLWIDKNKITRIIFQYPEDSGFVAAKKDGTWMIGNQKADSTKIANYLSQLAYKNLSDFADNFSPAEDPSATITIDSSSKPIAMIKAWKKDTSWIFHSTLRPQIYFSVHDADKAKDLLVGKQALYP